MKKFFYELFRDDNNINEKSIIGFFSFILLILTAILDVVTGLLGVDFPIHQFVFEGFLIMTLGAFGIASVDKFINRNKEEPESNDNKVYRNKGNRYRKPYECEDELG
jgi:pilus assembly protein TadC